MEILAAPAPPATPTTPAMPPPPPGSAPTSPTAADNDRLPGLLDRDIIYSKAAPLRFDVSGFVQLQYQASQASESQLDQGGASLNRDRFLVRRGRLHLERGWEFAAGILELEANNLRGPAVNLRRAEGTLLYRQNDPKAPPFLALTLGFFDVPFGYELVEPSRSRIPMERSQASLALFPAEPDYGVRLAAAAGPFRGTLAIVNGDSGDSRFSTDPNLAKDFVGRFGLEGHPSAKLHLSGGTSFLSGKGFHPGTAATKSSLIWRDVNQNGVVDPGEVTGVGAVAATPSQDFRHWALGADLEARVDTAIGATTLQAEAYVASNLDRGFLVADPVSTGLDVRELGYDVAVFQEVGRYGLLGFRADLYDPNADFLIERRGRSLPATARVRTLSPLVGVGIPGQARLLFQYDFIDDRLGIDVRGVPTDLANTQWTFRLQVLL